MLRKVMIVFYESMTQVIFVSIFNKDTKGKIDYKSLYSNHIRDYVSNTIVPRR